MNDTLIDVLTQVVTVDHFDENLYERVVQVLRGEGKTSKLLNSIANTLEEYYNLHNSRSLFGGSKMAIPPEAENEREDLKLYIEALRQGISDFRSEKELRARILKP